MYRIKLGKMVVISPVSVRKQALVSTPASKSKKPFFFSIYVGD
jgi:hypothetical protein